MPGMPGIPGYPARVTAGRAHPPHRGVIARGLQRLWRGRCAHWGLGIGQQPQVPATAPQQARDQRQARGGESGPDTAAWTLDIGHSGPATSFQATSSSSRYNFGRKSTLISTLDVTFASTQLNSTRLHPTPPPPPPQDSVALGHSHSMAADPQPAASGAETAACGCSPAAHQLPCEVAIPRRTLVETRSPGHYPSSKLPGLFFPAPPPSAWGGVHRFTPRYHSLARSPPAARHSTTRPSGFAT
ncbi:predicted protein [Histoplasma capsulatum var. duboisii H88]|uniref:Predicted protein n=1 Tax=Ajellomyces capsulatus (strain H88) TaxID=544711 RepID=F0URG4_AJEC8|nr:predicted protein [Histoplasma capsulatum var. duboisii H88]